MYSIKFIHQTFGNLFTYNFVRLFEIESDYVAQVGLETTLWLLLNGLCCCGATVEQADLKLRGILPVCVS